MTTMLHDELSSLCAADALRIASRVPCRWAVRARAAFGGASYTCSAIDMSPEGIRLQGTPSWSVGQWLVLHVETPHGSAGVEARVVRVCSSTGTWAVRFDGLDRSGVRFLIDLLERNAV
jgi:hypothetical protein